MAARRTSPKKRTRSDSSSRVSKSAAREKSTSPLISPIASDILIGVLLFLSLIFVYSDYIIEGKVDVHPDTISQGAPFNKFADDFTKTYGDHPLWFPHIFSGMPFQASGTYHNVQYTFERLIRTFLPAELFSLLHGRFLFHLMLGGVSMFLLARALSLSRLAGFIAAIAFIFNSHVIGTDHVNRVACFMHIPLIFLAAYRLFERQHIFYAILLGGAFGSQLGSYHPQIAHYTGMMLGLYFVYNVVVHFQEQKPLRPMLITSGYFSLALVIAVAMASVLILPMQEYAQYSARNLSVGGSAVNVPFATSWSFPPMEIFTFIIPSFTGFGGQTYWGDMPFTDFPNYLGVLVVVLAIIGLIYHRNRITLFLGLLVLCALLVSFGRHFTPVSWVMLNLMPYFSKFRAPVMILILVQFAGALLAGYGVQALLNLTRDQVSSGLKRNLGIMAAAVAALVFLLTLSGTSFQSFMASIYDQADVLNGRQAGQLNTIRFEMFMQDLWTMTFILGAGVVLIILYLTDKIGYALFAVGLSGLIIVDLMLVAFKLVDPQYEKGRVDAYYASRQQDPIVQHLQQDTDLFRVLPTSNPGTNEYGYFGISTLYGYHAAKMGIYQELIDSGALNSFGVLNMLNTKYFISQQPLSGPVFSPVIESDQGYLYRNATALPRAFLVDSLKVLTDKTAILQELQQPTFNPAAYAILEEPVNTALGPSDSSTVQITNYNPHRIDLMVKATAPCLLVLSEVYYPPGWTAVIDDTPAQIYKTNYVLRSIVIPAGQHDVTFEFNPSSFRIGHLLSRISSALVLLVLIAAGVIQVRKRRESGKQ